MRNAYVLKILVTQSDSKILLVVVKFLDRELSQYPVPNLQCRQVRAKVNTLHYALYEISRIDIRNVVDDEGCDLVCSDMRVFEVLEVRKNVECCATQNRYGATVH